MPYVVGITTKQIIDYIEHDNRELAKSTKCSPHSILEDLYYLLADYYFKNKETGYVVKPGSVGRRRCFNVAYCGCDVVMMNIRTFIIEGKLSSSTWRTSQ